jgi:hypothetical protein
MHRPLAEFDRKTPQALANVGDAGRLPLGAGNGDVGVISTES